MMDNIPGHDREGNVLIYWPARAKELLRVKGIPIHPPARTPIVHPCPRCGQGIFVQFRGLGRTARILDVDEDAEHECPPEKRSMDAPKPVPVPTSQAKTAPKPKTPGNESASKKVKPARSKGFLTT